MLEPENRLHSRYPELGEGPLPIEPFVSSDYYELEKKHIFKKLWLHVGRVEEIPGAGDYFVRDLPASDASVLVVRNKKGEIHAMHNVCSHRLNKLVYDTSGCASRFVCKFHSWMYNLDGELKGVPDSGQFNDFRREDYNLTPIHVDVWEGFIFLNLAQEPALTLKEFLQPMFGGLEGYPFHLMKNCYSWKAVVNCNWKMALDAFQETYHVQAVHGNSIANALEKAATGTIRPIDGLCGEFHRRLSIAGNPNTVYGNPGAATSASIEADDGPGAAMRRNMIGELALKHGRGGVKFDGDANQLPPGLNWTKNPNWAFDINVVFPYFYLSTRPNYFQAYNFQPLSHDKFLFDARVYYPDVDTAGGRFYQEYMKVALRDVLLEDLFTLERLQEGAETSAKTNIVLADDEIMVRHNFWVIDRLIREGEARDA